MPPRPVVPPELTRGPFTVEQAARAGLTRWHLQGKSWRSLDRDLYVWSGLEDSPLLRLAAARLRLPEAAVFSGRTAAWLHGLDIPPCAPIQAILPTERWPSHRGSLATSRARLSPDEVVLRHGFPTTSIERTLLDLSRASSLTEAVVIVDCALRLGLVSKPQLGGAAQPGLGGVKKFREVIGLAEPKAESQMESRLRMLLVLGGLPRPQVQVDLHDASGGRLARADLYYPSHRLVIEYDGGTHRTSLIQDDQRQNRLLAAGYQLLRYTAPDVLRAPELAVAQVRGVLLS